MIRRFIKKKLEGAAVSKVTIERAANRVRVNIHTARPGVVIGRKAAELDKLKDEIRAITTEGPRDSGRREGNQEPRTRRAARGREYRAPDRAPHHLAPRDEEGRADDHGHGRRRRHPRPLLRPTRPVGEIARTEEYREGKVPLHTLRANIDYGFAEARTTVAGKIGVKCWICRKDEVTPVTA